MDFLQFWQTLPMRIDPVFITLFGQDIIRFGSDASGAGFAIRYYGLMYIVAFVTGLWLLKRMSERGETNVSADEIENTTLWAIVGLMVGARIGYALFYNFAYYSKNLLEIFMPFSNGQFTGISGMSYHGGLIGGFLGGLIYVLVKKLSVKECANAIFLAVPLSQAFGRLGNFLNGELFGRATQSAIGMYFPADPHTLRYPSQLFQMVGEGFAVFFILLALRKFLPKAKEITMPLYLVLYGVFRFFIEFFREPDAHIGLNALNLSRGQELCLFMAAAGIILIPVFLADWQKLRERRAVHGAKR